MITRELAVWRRRLGPLSLPLSWLYGLGAGLHELRYRSEPSRLPTPVVSVGNLSVGGEGKTPIVAAVVRELMAERDVAILSRGYGRLEPGRVEVVADGAGLCVEPQLAGDEPVMLSRQLPGVTIAVGGRRLDAGKLVLERGLRPVFVLDDGFQHRQLARDLDIVCMDASMPVEAMALLPRGSFRESWTGLVRADMLLWTYWEDRLRESPVVRRVDRLLKGRLERGERCPDVFHARFDIDSLERVDQSQEGSLGDITGVPVAVMAAIARPDRLIEHLRAAGLDVRHQELRPDHHWWTLDEAREVAELAASKGALCLLATDKDAVKLDGLRDSAIPVWRLVQRVSLEEPVAFRQRLFEVNLENAAVG